MRAMKMRGIALSRADHEISLRPLFHHQRTAHPAYRRAELEVDGHDQFLWVLNADRRIPQGAISLRLIASLGHRRALLRCPG